MKKTIIISVAMVLSLGVFAQDFVEWRGENRTGVYNEKGLLTEWPADGPQMLWSVDSIPEGYSTVSIAHNTIYLTGLSDTLDVLMAFTMDGKEKWRKPYGRGWMASFTHSRSTPTIENDRLYVTSGMGDIACFNALTGDIIWEKKASEDYNGTYGKWGISESILLLNDKVYYTPGGESTTMVALDKMTGKEIWKSESVKEEPSYVSPLLIERGGKKIICTLTEKQVLGIDPENGSIIWKFNYGEYAGGKWKANIQCNTPLYHEGKIFITNGYDHKTVMLNLAKDASSVELAYVDSTLDVHHGGAVRIGDYVYGSNWINNRKGNWVCLEWETGKVMYETEWETKGPIIANDGYLYCYDEKKGNMALVKANPAEFKVISSFKVPLGKGPHWSHPVIQDGVLYIRHEGALMAYNLKK